MSLRYAIRALRAAPPYSACVVATLSVGLAAGLAIFSIIDAVYFAPLPFRGADRLVLLEQPPGELGWPCVCSLFLSRRELEEGVRDLKGVQDAAGLTPVPTVISLDGASEQMYAAAVTTNWFSILGLAPAFGRAFLPDDERPGAEAVVVLSDRLWRERLGADTAVIGRQLRIDDHLHRVVGIMPPQAAIGFTLYTGDSTQAPFFVPAGQRSSQNRDFRFTNVVARVQADGHPELVAQQLATRLNHSDRGVLDRVPGLKLAGSWRVESVNLRKAEARANATAYKLFLGAILLCLLLACANLAALFVARMSTKYDEILIRACLGAGRFRMLDVFLGEGLIIAASAGAFAVILAHFALDLARFPPAGVVPYWTRVHLGTRVVLAGIAADLVCVSLFVVGPSLALLPRVGSPSQDSGDRRLLTRRSSAGFRRGLLIVQIAVSLTLVSLAAFLGRTFIDSATRDLGLAKHSVLRGGVRLVDTDTSAAAHSAFLERLTGSLTSLPGIEDVALMGHSSDPASKGMSRESDGAMLGPAAAPTSALLYDSRFIRVLGNRLVAGREFSTHDDRLAPAVAIVDEATARHLFPGQTAIGKRVKFGAPSENTSWITIVGVIADGAGYVTGARSSHYNPEMYRPLAQGLATGKPMTSVGFAVRTRGSPAAYKPAIRRAIHQIAPMAVVSEMTTIDERVEFELAPVRMRAAIVGVLAIYALVLVALGVYGVLASLLAQQWREIGLRMALGATSVAIERWMLNGLLRPVTIGIAGGIVISMGATRAARSVLYTTSPTDPTLFALAALSVLIAATVAAARPVWRAGKVGAAQVLRGVT